MGDKDAYQQKMQAQLDEWRAELDRMRARMSGASADAKLEFEREAEVLEGKIEAGKKKLSELGDASDHAWESLKDGVESAWKSLKLAIGDAASKFKR